MKILLIYPPREHHMFGTTPHNFIEPEAGYYPPIGLLYIAAYLEKNKDNTVKVIDAYTDKIGHKQIKEIVRTEKPDIVGIYFSTFYLYDGILVAKTTKEVSPDSIVVAGGPHTVLYPKETIAIPEVNYVMLGESEESFSELVDYVRNKNFSAIGNIPNVVTKNSAYDKEIVRARIQDLDNLPFPARHLIDHCKYKSILAKRNPITTVISSRGCPFKCKFCSNLESGQKVRYRSAKNVVDELEQCVKKFDIYDFLFFDELFTVNKQRVLDICAEVEKRNLKIRWHCRSRADVIDEEMVAPMKKAGCRLIQFGIETGSQRLQQYINKNLDLDKVRKVIKAVAKGGILTYGDFMFGLPTETTEETQATVKLAKELPLDYAVFGMFGPMYGSVFYDEGLKEGKFKDFWREFVNNPQIPIKDGSWTNQDAEKYFGVMSDTYRNFYLRPNYILRRIMRTDSMSQMRWQIKAGLHVFSKLFKFFE